MLQDKEGKLDHFLHIRCFWKRVRISSRFIPECYFAPEFVVLSYNCVLVLLGKPLRFGRMTMLPKISILLTLGFNLIFFH